MWLFTKYGFFSVKQDKQDRYFVRARRRTDLENLCQEMDNYWRQSATDPMLIVATVEQIPMTQAALESFIHEWPAADYRYRLIVSKKALGVLFAAFVDSIDYPNFKSEVAKHPDQKDHLALYHKVWGTMAGLQE